MIRIFRHYISGIFLGLILLEIGVFFSSIYCGSLLRYQNAIPVDRTLIVQSCLYTLVMLMSNTGMGLYQRMQTWGEAGLLLRVLVSLASGTLVMSLLFYAFPEIELGRGVFGYTLFSTFLGVTILRLLFYSVVDQKVLKRRVVVFGAGRNAQKIVELERANGTQNIRVIGCIVLDHQPTFVAEEKLIHLKVPLNEYALQEDIDEIVIAPDDRRSGLPVDEFLDCRMNGFEVVDLLTFFEREAGFIRVDALYPSWLVFSDGFRAGFLRLSAKRIFDIAASLILLSVTWPVMLLTMIAIKLESRFKGPVLYSQARVGMSWRLFNVIKFRSMRLDAEATGKPRMASRDDDRVTGIGKFIRKFRIDELPQLFNVLKGEMSFVGPRPERPEFVEQFAESIPYYSERHRVKPGITGWAQLCYPYGENENDALQKLQYDLYYVKNYSLFFDLIIILQTIEVVIWGKGAR
ncbi:MAG: TIGR03013 family PEP-CTERM/XrtA system glycosyltransferase [Methylococcaceae bacterium]|nr:TIGR03013 family PEP-CTERM/XrtA system glycosyltransferase [Methylococcaceae bacterium]MCI0732271.1 TIGR03013 family PEP-CTERM/XrtA system glycosyltransferase [Methylococcaceae bacterium]